MQNIPVAHFEAASTLAVVAASNGPLLFLTADQKVIAASASFCRAFDIDPAMVVGRTVAEIGHGEWDVPGLRSLLQATAAGGASVDAYEVVLKRKTQKSRQLVVNARRLDDGLKDQVRLLLSITDVTDLRDEARLKDELIRDKAVLLQELQHRVANSLQIISSVLLQSARQVQSEEARGHLRNAHLRVMSIATVQKQLSVLGAAKVPLRAYLAHLCESLGVSMIADSDMLSITVTADDSEVSADTSVSLGLIVTELVINALKHAFRGRAKGSVTIDFHSDGDDWTLSVTDDGNGMPVGAAAPKPGLGSGIIAALTKNLKGELQVSDAKPGTAVTIRHRSGSMDKDSVGSAA